jgi:hypothetical protein
LNTACIGGTASKSAPNCGGTDAMKMHSPQITLGFLASERRSSFLKKRTKKLLAFLMHCRSSARQHQKVFCFAQGGRRLLPFF